MMMMVMSSVKIIGCFLCLLAVSPLTLGTETCSVYESRVLVCLNIFVDFHQEQINAIKGMNTCPLEDVTCQQYSQTVICVNKLSLSDSCREDIKEEINEIIAKQNITCTVTDLADFCPGSPVIIETVSDSNNGADTCLMPTVACGLLYVAAGLRKFIF